MSLRTPLSVTPHLYMGDSTGRPLDKGVVYFGEQDKDPEFYPIELFSDDELTLPLMQPVHTKGGYLYDKGDMVEPHAKEVIYSVKVLDSYGRKVFYKGAMMRNSWNDDVIDRINEGLLSAGEAAQAAFDVAAAKVTANAAAAVNAAIEGVAIDANLITDALVATVPKAGGGVARSQKSINDSIFRVKDFGAVGDGVTDDAPAIKRAILAASAAGGGEVLFEPSATSYASRVNSLENIHNVVLNGNGQKLITLDPADQGVDGGARAVLSFKDSSNIDIHGFTFDAQYTKWVSIGRRVNNHNLAFSNCNNVTIYNNTLKDCGYPNGTGDEAGDSIYTSGNCYEFNISDNTFINPARWAIVFTFQSIDCRGITIRNNTQIVDRVNYSLGFIDVEPEIAENGVVNPVRIYDTIITGNTVYFSCYIAMSGASYENVFIRDNIFHGYTYGLRSTRVYKDADIHNYGFGIVIGSRAGRPNNKNIFIERNIFNNVNKNNIHLVDKYEDVFIVDNILTAEDDSPNDTKFSSGIQVTNVSGLTISGNIVKNKNTSTTTVGMGFGNLTGLCSVTHNHLQQAFSNSSLTITTLAGAIVDVSNNFLESQNRLLSISGESNNVVIKDNTCPPSSKSLADIKSPVLTFANNSFGAVGVKYITTKINYNPDSVSIAYLKVIPVDGYWQRGSIIYNTTQASNGTSALGWMCFSEGYATAKVWVAGSVIAKGSTVNYKGRAYQAESSGTTGSTGPEHTTGVVSDGAVDWLYLGANAAFKPFGAKASNVTNATGTDDTSIKLNELIASLKGAGYL